MLKKELISNSFFFCYNHHRGDTMSYQSDLDKLITRACYVFSKYESNNITQSKEYQSSLIPIRKKAQELGISIDYLYKEYEKRKMVIEEAKSVFRAMDGTSINSQQIARRLQAVRKQAEELGIKLGKVYSNPNDLCSMFDTEIDINTVEVSDPINEEYCEACLRSFLSSKRFESRYVTVSSSIPKEESLAVYAGPAYWESFKEGIKVFLEKMKKGDTTLLNKRVLAKFEGFGIERIEEHLKKGNDSEVAEYFKWLFKNIYYHSGDEHMGSTRHNDGNASLFVDALEGEKYVYRIYLNLPRNEETIQFIKEYQIECQKRCMSFDMKPFFQQSQEHFDGTIFYISYNNINTCLNIIKDLLRKHPNMSMGTPPAACATIDELPNVGICHMGLVDKSGENLATYNDYINKLFENTILLSLKDEILARPDINEVLKTDLKEDRRIYWGKQSLRLYVYTNNFNTYSPIIKKILTEIMNSDGKEAFIKRFCDIFHQEHNRLNGYPLDAKKSIPLDMWYIDEERERNRKKEISK